MGKNKRPRMSEEDKRKKFGDDYDPDYTKKQRAQGQARTETNEKPSRNTRQDWEWHAISEQIAKDVGNFAYNTLTGQTVRVPIDSDTATESLDRTLNWNVQGVLEVKYSNAINPTTDESDLNGIAMASNQLYTYVRHVNSGAKNYEAPDLMYYVLAMCDIYSEAAEIARALGSARYFNFENRYLPKMLFQAMHIDYEDCVSNIAQYRGTYNVLVKRINSLAVPKYFTVFLRKALIAGNIFTDSDSMRGQMIVHNRALFYVWSGTESGTGTSLVAGATAAYNGVGQSSLKVETLQERLERLRSMLNAVELDTDALTMSGDILHAFKDADLYQLQELPTDWIVAPVFNEDVLAQVENSRSIGDYLTGGGYPTDPSAFNFTQSNGQIVYQPVIQAMGVGQTVVPQRILFNSHKSDPDFKDNLEWSRLISLYEIQDITAQPPTMKIRVISCGTELVLGYAMYGSDGEGNVQYAPLSQVITGTGSSAAITGGIAAVAKLTQFDWHPTVYVYTRSNTTVGTPYSGIQVLADCKKYVWLDFYTVSQINDSAVAAAFYARGLYEHKR